MSSDGHPIVLTDESSSTGWVSLCGKMAPIASIVVFTAPLPTMRRIQRDRSVGALPMLPYSSMIVACALWISYGVLKSEPKVYRTNSIGMVFSSCYFLFFRKYCPRSANGLPGTVPQHIRGIILIVSLTIMIHVTMAKDKAAELIGKTGVVFCVLLFASPLAALKNVLLTKSAKSIPLPFTIATVINCGLWSVFGLLEKHDFNIYAPNLLGLAFGIAQLALIGIYGDGGAVSSANHSEVETLKIEMA